MRLANSRNGAFERLEDGLAEGGVGQRLIWRQFERFADPGAQANDLDEIVEVPGLKRGILAVVGEAQKLLVLIAIAGIAEPVEDGEGRDRRGGAAAFAAQLGELGAFIGLGVEEHASRRVEEQRRLHEPAPPFQGLCIRAVAEFVEIELDREETLFSWSQALGRSWYA